MRFIVIIVIALLIAPGIFASTTEERLEALERRMGDVEAKAHQNQEKISRLVAWQEVAEEAIISLGWLIEEMWDWMSFWGHDNLCSAVDSCSKDPVDPGECSSAADCPVSEWIGERYCEASDVYRTSSEWTCRDPGTPESSCVQSTVPRLVEQCEHDCREGICVTSQIKVIFRTNAANGDYRSGSWIAIDTDSDGAMEGYSYTSGSGRVYSCGSDPAIGKTPEGHVVYLSANGPFVCVDMGNYYSIKRYLQSSSDAIIADIPLEPYASDGQEVYDGGAWKTDAGSPDYASNTVDIKAKIVTGAAS